MAAGRSYMFLFLLAKGRQQMKTMVPRQLPPFRSVLVGASWPDRGRAVARNEHLYVYAEGRQQADKSDNTKHT